MSRASQGKTTHIIAASQKPRVETSMTTLSPEADQFSASEQASLPDSLTVRPNVTAHLQNSNVSVPRSEVATCLPLRTDTEKHRAGQT